MSFSLFVVPRTANDATDKCDTLLSKRRLKPTSPGNGSYSDMMGESLGL